MRKSIIFLCTAILLFCIWLLLHRKSEPEKSTLPEVQTSLTNQQPASQAPTTPIQTAKSPSISKPSAASLAEAEAKYRATPEGSNAFQQSILADWQRPIEFYGKVVGENTNPVAGANVTFKWAETPSKDGNKTANTESDANGLFSLRGQRGPSLEIWVSKKGYYASQRGQKGVSYLHGDFSPDPLNPVIFLLRKKGKGEPLVGLNRSYRIPRDGTPVSINLTTGATATSESGDFVVRCWTQDAGKRSGEKYDWRCVVSIPGGGAVTNNEEFAFQALENGYTPSLEIAMPADRPDWQDDVDLKFYYRLADGHYGRMTFSMIAGGHHFCMIDSVLNPTGSRNLEPAQ